MDFIDEIKVLAARIPKQLEHIQTEEATKSALVMPFINALGYNVFDPTEVIPEYTADVGTKKGEKVDYAIFQNGKPIMLFECKWRGADLDTVDASQLYRYFSVADARLAVLTNGVVYRFFTDLEAPNKLDTKPFLVFDMLNIDEALVPELKKLTKTAFNVEHVLSSAGELKYTREIKRLLSEQLVSPEDEFVRFFGTRVYSGRMTQQVREQFSGIVKQAFRHFINDRINETLKSALNTSVAKEVAPEAAGAHTAPAPEPAAEDTNDIVTTAEEIEAYYIIKSILRGIVDPSRIRARDSATYMGILLDDSNRKTICRLQFNYQKKRFIVFFGENKAQTRLEIKSLDDIYLHEDKLKTAVAWYESHK